MGWYKYSKGEGIAGEMVGIPPQPRPNVKPYNPGSLFGGSYDEGYDNPWSTQPNPHQKHPGGIEPDLPHNYSFVAYSKPHTYEYVYKLMYLLKGCNIEGSIDIAPGQPRYNSKPLIPRETYTAKCETETYESFGETATRCAQSSSSDWNGSPYGNNGGYTGILNKYSYFMPPSESISINQEFHGHTTVYQTTDWLDSNSRYGSRYLYNNPTQRSTINGGTYQSMVALNANYIGANYSYDSSNSWWYSTSLGTYSMHFSFSVVREDQLYSNDVLYLRHLKNPNKFRDYEHSGHTTRKAYYKRKDREDSKWHIMINCQIVPHSIYDGNASYKNSKNGGITYGGAPFNYLENVTEHFGGRETKGNYKGVELCGHMEYEDAYYWVYKQGVYWKNIKDYKVYTGEVWESWSYDPCSVNPDWSKYKTAETLEETEEIFRHYERDIRVPSRNPGQGTARDFLPELPGYFNYDPPGGGASSGTPWGGDLFLPEGVRVYSKDFEAPSFSNYEGYMRCWDEDGGNNGKGGWKVDCIPGTNTPGLPGNRYFGHPKMSAQDFDGGNKFETRKAAWHPPNDRGYLPDPTSSEIDPGTGQPLTPEPYNDVEIYEGQVQYVDPMQYITGDASIFGEEYKIVAQLPGKHVYNGGFTGSLNLNIEPIWLDKSSSSSIHTFDWSDARKNHRSLIEEEQFGPWNDGANIIKVQGGKRTPPTVVTSATAKGTIT